MLGLLSVFVTSVTPPSIGDLMEPVTNNVISTIWEITPLGIGVFVVLAGIGIAIAVFRKFGVRR